MAIPENDKRVVADLLSSWSSPPSDENLNLQLRNDLHFFAKTTGLSYTVRCQLTNVTMLHRGDTGKQDYAGNIYMNRPGLDSSLSSIALTFPHDSTSPSGSFESVLRTFLRLQSMKTTTDVALLGLTSPSNSQIGMTPGKVRRAQGIYTPTIPL